MADFEPGFANENTNKRFANATEIAQGFGCGPADINLFNMLFNQIWEELGEVITWGGITHTNDRNTLVREAIQAKLTPFLEEVNGDNDGGVISPNAQNEFVLRMSNAIEWSLRIPEADNYRKSVIQLPTRTINDSFSASNITSTTYNRNYPTSTVWVRTNSTLYFGVEKNNIANVDAKGSCKCDTTIDGSVYRTVTGQFNGITASPSPTSDLVSTSFHGSSMRSDTGSGNVAISVDMQVTDARLNTTTANDFILQNVSGGYIEITEIRN